MKIQIAELATFLSSIALIAKILDWWLTPEEKERLRGYIIKLLKEHYITSSAVVKAPLSIFTQLFNSTFGNRILSKRAFCRSAVLSGFLLLSCLAVGGVRTNTFFGISETPWSAYENALLRLEKVVQQSGSAVGREKLKDEKRVEAENCRQEMLKRIAIAREPYWKWIYSFVLIMFVLAINLVTNVASMAFARKVMKDLLMTESLILISGALLLGLFISIVLVNIVVIALFTITTEFVALTGGLASLAFSYSKLLGIGVTIGYGLLAWLSSSAWIKAAAVSAIVPSLALLILALISAILYPFRRLIGASISSCLTRAVQSEKGILLFIATGATLLAAVVIMVTNLVASAK